MTNASDYQSQTKSSKSLKLSKKLSLRKPVDPDDLNSNSDDEILYPGMSSKEKRLVKIKKRDEEINS
jgi:hypothetical protein